MMTHPVNKLVSQGYSQWGPRVTGALSFAVYGNLLLLFLSFSSWEFRVSIQLNTIECVLTIREAENCCCLSQ